MEVLLLAAGEAKRMGFNKLMLPYKGKPLLIHALESALEASSKVVLVTGCYEPEVLDTLKTYSFINHPSLVVLHNPNYSQGQFSSTLVGLQAITKGQCCAIALSDAPLIKKEHYAFLLDHLEDYDGVRVFYHSTPGHPMLCSSNVVELALKEKNTSSMRTFLVDKYINNIESGDPSWVTDIDTIDSYNALSRL